MQHHKPQGFSVAELLISLAIIVLLATFAIFQLGSSQQTDELQTAARQLAADLRSMQSRALAGQNLKACTDGSDLRVCEYSEASCTPGTCTEEIPYSFGINITQNSTNYSTFADLNPVPGGDNALTNSKEVILTRDLLQVSNNVIISTIQSASSSGLNPPQVKADISFTRQNGVAHIIDSTVPPEPSLILITLKHIETNATIQVEVNRVTGRISIL